jgi:hypothetical protein
VTASFAFFIAKGSFSSSLSALTSKTINPLSTYFSNDKRGATDNPNPFFNNSFDYNTSFDWAFSTNPMPARYSQDAKYKKPWILRVADSLEELKMRGISTIPIVELIPKIEIGEKYLFVFNNGVNGNSAYTFHPQQSIYDVKQPNEKHFDISLSLLMCFSKKSIKKV